MAVPPSAAAETAMDESPVYFCVCVSGGGGCIYRLKYVCVFLLFCVRWGVVWCGERWGKKKMGGGEGLDTHTTVQYPPREALML